jgi:signal transduction histidine kinase
MDSADLVDRLANLSNLAGIPREELGWLVAHGDYEVHEAGTVVAPKGERVERLWIILSGHIAVRVDRGAGPRRVMGWRTGEVTGMLPYSRMTGPPGDNYLEERTEVVTIHEDHFPEMIYRCPAFTTHTVHVMLDRARRFNASDLQDEKMISLGRLAAGLAHELNNPASATVRGAKLLLAGLADADAASRVLGAAGLTDEASAAIERTRAACLGKPVEAVLSPIQRADHEEEIADWLARHGSDPGQAATLAETAVTTDALDALAKATSGDTLDAAIRWIAAGCSMHSLAVDIERAATRIYDLVAAVKRFTYMDSRAGEEFVDVEPGLRDTLRVVGSKAKSKGAAITLDVEPDLPRVHATGGELNQIWLNLIDNALDAIPESGTIDIRARTELDRVVVRVVDNGPGIPPEVIPRIFDPFFTTKPPGQGTGLGLEIARRLVRGYHGDISVDSQPGRTEFRVSLVVESPAPAGVGGPGGEGTGD